MMSFELMCCESVMLSEIKAKDMTQKCVAQTYALSLRSQENKDGRIDWAKVNKAIIDRWSFPALKKIKNMAHSGKCFEANQ